MRFEDPQFWLIFGVILIPSIVQALLDSEGGGETRRFGNWIISVGVFVVLFGGWLKYVDRTSWSLLVLIGAVYTLFGASSLILNERLPWTRSFNFVLTLGFSFGLAVILYTP